MLMCSPIHLKDANRFVSLFHRHNQKVAGSKFAIAAMVDNKIVGVAIAGRPVARKLDDGQTLEISRVCELLALNLLLKLIPDYGTDQIDLGIMTKFI